ncbi:hypothetical protein [Rhodococcus triatomae]|nr:hypothetical protein G419_11077 [Rhodococcus triatomae BKS 15-14]
MRLPLWIGGPIVISLAAADAAIELQARAVGALTRATIRAMDNDAALGAAPLIADHATAEHQSAAAGR